MVFLFLSLLTFPLWFLNLHSWFRWAKTISVLIPTCFVSFIRIANDGDHENTMHSLRKKWPLWILYVVLMLNIVEATLTDFELGTHSMPFAVSFMHYYSTANKALENWKK